MRLQVNTPIVARLLCAFFGLLNYISRRAAEHDDCKGRLRIRQRHPVALRGLGRRRTLVAVPHRIGRQRAFVRPSRCGIHRPFSRSWTDASWAGGIRQAAVWLRPALPGGRHQSVSQRHEDPACDTRGLSVAGSEETLFAGTYPARVDKLVYLDSAEDYKSGYELATNPLTAYPLPLPSPGGPLGEIVKGSQQHDPDYTQIVAPALSFVTIYDAPYIPADADAALRARIITRWNDYGNPFQRRKIDHFKRDMRNGKVIEVHDADHGDFISDANFQKFSRPRNAEVPAE